MRSWSQDLAVVLQHLPVSVKRLEPAGPIFAVWTAPARIQHPRWFDDCLQPAFASGPREREHRALASRALPPLRQSSAPGPLRIRFRVRSLAFSFELSESTVLKGHGFSRAVQQLGNLGFSP